MSDTVSAKPGTDPGAVGRRALRRRRASRPTPCVAGTRPVRSGKSCCAPGSALATEYALAEITPAWTSLRMFAGSEAKAWNEFIGKHCGAR